MLVEPILDGLAPVRGPGRGVHDAGRAVRPRTRPCAFRRLAIRYDRTASTITAAATLALTVSCARWLTPKDY